MKADMSLSLLVRGWTKINAVDLSVLLGSYLVPGDPP